LTPGRPQDCRIGNDGAYSPLREPLQKNVEFMKKITVLLLFIAGKREKTTFAYSTLRRRGRENRILQQMGKSFSSAWRGFNEIAINTW
jgi:hypothetical protein